MCPSTSAEWVAPDQPEDLNNGIEDAKSTEGIRFRESIRVCPVGSLHEVIGSTSGVAQAINSSDSQWARTTTVIDHYLQRSLRECWSAFILPGPSSLSRLRSHNSSPLQSRSLMQEMVTRKTATWNVFGLVVACASILCHLACGPAHHHGSTCSISVPNTFLPACCCGTHWMANPTNCSKELEVKHD